jgi:hypothetical protein
MKTIDQRFAANGEPAITLCDGRIQMDYGWYLDHADHSVGSALLPALEQAAIEYQFDGKLKESRTVRNLLRSMAKDISRYGDRFSVRTVAFANYFKIEQPSEQMPAAA